MTVEPEVLAVAVAVVDGQRREIAALYAGDDRVGVLLLHQDAVDAQNEVRSELARDAVEVVIRRLIAVQLAGLVAVGAVQLAHPCAFKDLDRVGDHHRTHIVRVFLHDLALLQRELAVGHFVLRLVARPGELHGFLEVLRVVVDEVDGALAGAEDVLRGVGGIAAVEEHGVAALARHIVRRDQGVGSERRGAVLGKGADNDGRHRVVQRGLVEVVHDPQVFKAAHKWGVLLI